MEDLLKALQSMDEAERLYAVEDIAELGTSEAAIPLIYQLAREQSETVKNAVVFALTHLDCKQVYEQLFEFFTSTDAFLRNAAVTIFGAGGEEAVAYLTSKLDYQDREVRKLVLDALFEIGSPETLLVIRAGLYDESPNVQITAVEYLGRLNDDEAVPDMISILSETDEPMLKAAILETLSMVGKAENIQDVLDVMMPAGDIMGVDSFYLAPLTDLTARVGSIEHIIKMLGAVENIELYGAEVVNIIDTVCKRMGDIFDHEEILAKAREIIVCPEVASYIRYDAVKCIVHRETSSVPGSEYQAIAKALLDENNPEMLLPAVRLLARSGTDKDMEKIRELAEDTEDNDLLELCEEMNKEI
ncbi:HEAT repeat domain-containing protein [Desulfobacterota bacterium M19]